MQGRPKRNPYFLRIEAALKRAGIATPTLVIDRRRLNDNIHTLMHHLPEGMALRLVAKSLPSLPLLQHIMEATGTSRLMTFNLQMLLEISHRLPQADQLLGKPLPVAAARAYYEKLSKLGNQTPTPIKWLIDTPERLAQYEALAIELGQSLDVALELDVGLHRGGFVPGEHLSQSLQTISKSNLLTFSGYVGYEPHIPALPEKDGWRQRAIDGAWSIYQSAKDEAASVLGAAAVSDCVWNAAGSPTYRLYEDTNLANEVSVGSVLVKPTNFDTDLLTAHIASSFVATPVLKVDAGVKLPGAEYREANASAVVEEAQSTLFTYGGKWMADPVDPPKLETNAIFGRSSNQEMLNGPADLDIRPDDFVFFRPHQSEAIFLHFGDIAIYDDSEIVDHWPVFDASA